MPVGQHDETAETPNSSMESRELEQKITQAVNNLPPKCKAVFVLSRYEGLKYKQIAEHLDISVKTVENQMGSALQKLRDELKPYLTREFLMMMIVIGLACFLLAFWF